MKCPLRKVTEKNKRDDGNGMIINAAFQDCIEEQCAWWYILYDRCIIVDIAISLDELRKKGE